MANRGHLADTLKHNNNGLESADHDSFSTELVEQQTENAFVVVGASLPTTNYDNEEWKANFPHFFSGVIPPTVPQSGSFLSQICDDMDTQKWTTVGFEDVLPPAQKLPLLKQSKRSRSVEDEASSTPNELQLKREAEKEKNRERMRRLRASRDEEKIARDREKARERTRRVRASWDEPRRKKERERAREYMRKRRAMKAAESKQDLRFLANNATISNNNPENSLP